MNLVMLPGAEDVRQGTDDWLAARKRGLGASEAAALLGVHPFTSLYAIYLDKRGEGQPVEVNAAMEWGTLLEPVVAEMFTRRVEPDAIWQPRGVLAHPEHEFMLLSPDRLITVDGQTEYLEIKTSGQADEWGAEGSDEVPLHAAAQVQWALEVLDLDAGRIAVLLGDHGFDLRTYRIARDRDLTAELIRRGAEFWYGHVLPGIPPALDGSKATSEALRSRYAVADDIELVADEALARDVKKYLLVKEQLDLYKTEVERFANTIKARMGTATRLIAPDVKVSWSNVRGRTTTNWERIAGDLATQLQLRGVTVDLEALKAEHSTVADPYRRFVAAWRKS